LTDFNVINDAITMAKFINCGSVTVDEARHGQFKGTAQHLKSAASL